MSEKIGVTNRFMDEAGKGISADFEGVLACDQLLKFYNPNRKKKGKSIVFVNTASSNMKNGHYCAIAINWERMIVIVFCSLALSWFDPNIEQFVQNFLRQHPKFTLKLSPFQIQPTQSYFCGIHTLAFLASQHKRFGESFEDFYTRFERSAFNLKENDKIVLKYVLNFIEKSL